MKLKGVYLVDVILLLGYGPFTWFEVGLEMTIFFVSFVVGICKCKWWGKNGAVVLVCGGGRTAEEDRKLKRTAGGLLPDPIQLV
jgi:hypothetical protein